MIIKIKKPISDDASIKPEDASYIVDVLTRCVVRKDKIGKKSIKIVPLKEVGEPLVVSVPISQVKSFKLLNDVIYLQGWDLNDFFFQIAFQQYDVSKSVIWFRHLVMIVKQEFIYL